MRLGILKPGIEAQICSNKHSWGRRSEGSAFVFANHQQSPDIIKKHETPRLSPDDVRGRRVGLHVRSHQRRARRRVARGFQSHPHDAGLRTPRHRLSPLMAHHPPRRHRRRSSSRPLSRCRLPVPDHRPRPHYSIEIRLHHRTRRRPGSTLLHRSRTAAARRACSSLECISRCRTCLRRHSFSYLTNQSRRLFSPVFISA